MQLDINTPRGQETLIQEDRAYQIFTHNFPGWDVIKTDKKSEAI